MSSPSAAPSPSPASSFSLRRIAVPAFGPSLLFGMGEGAILPIVPLTPAGQARVQQALRDSGLR